MPGEVLQKQGFEGLVNLNSNWFRVKFSRLELSYNFYRSSYCKGVILRNVPVSVFLYLRVLCLVALVGR